METKRCSNCKLFKELGSFYVARRMRSGRSSRCKGCTSEIGKSHYLVNKDAIDARQRQRRLDSPAQVKAVNQRSYQKHAEMRIQKVREYAIKNPEVRARIGRNYRQRNPDKVTEQAAARRARKLQRTPKWADRRKIKEVYSNCPEGFTVDHIFPLQGEICSGLHIAENLQYLSLSDNCKKSNKMPDGVTGAAYVARFS